jgi:hypothetical protein
MSRVGKALKKLTLVYKTISLDEFIDYMKPKLQHFVKHNFMPRWEALQKMHQAFSSQYNDIY